jgi:hypothetical protein
MSRWETQVKIAQDLGARLINSRESRFARLWFQKTSFVGITLFGRIYIDEDYWDSDTGARVLRHEIVHFKDQKKWKLIFYVSYWLLPVGPSFKAYWEWRALQESIIDIEERSRSFLPLHRKNLMDSTAKWAKQCLYGKSYAFAWPFKFHVDRLVDRFIKKITLL